MKLSYPIVLEPYYEDGGGYVVTAPDMPGLTTFGTDLEDALAMAEDAASGWVLTELEDGKPAPKSSTLIKVREENPDKLVTLILIDMDTYAARYGHKSVRKNVTIPAWLDTFANEQHLNYSQVLRDGLEERYHELMGV